MNKPNENPSGYWTFEKCLEDAKLYNGRAEWKNNSSGAHAAANRNGWYKKCTAHMISPTSIYDKRLIYRWFAGNKLYVGLSMNLKQRMEGHKRGKSYQNLLREYGSIELEILETNLTAAQAEDREEYYVEKFRAQGWDILNIAKTGSVGNVHRRHNLKKCMTSSEKHDNVKSWKLEDHSAYTAAFKYGWLKQCTSHMNSLMRPDYTLEECMTSAKKWKSRAKWRLEDDGAYGAAQRNGWFVQCSAHMIYVQRPVGYWTLDKCQVIALRYTTVSEWQQNHGASYKGAFKNGWLIECKSHMMTVQDRPPVWPEERIIETLLKASNNGSMPSNRQMVAQGFSGCIKPIRAKGKGYYAFKAGLQLGDRQN